MLGIGFFAQYYGRSPMVFGAFPSMHCAFPMIGLLTAWGGATRSTLLVHGFYVAWMFCASIYLNHHWVVDGLAGWVVAAVAVFIASRILRFDWSAKQKLQSAPLRR
jgi:membrane-associated phospholipid phosphatase